MKSYIELIGEDVVSNEASLIQGTPIFPIMDYYDPASKDHLNDDQQELKPLKEIAGYIEAKFKSSNCYEHSWEFEPLNPSTLKIKSPKPSISTNITLSDAEALQYLLHITLESCDTSEFAIIDTQTAMQCLKDVMQYGVNINQPYKNWFTEKSNQDDITPLSQAVSAKNIELVNFLTDNGAVVTPSVLRANAALDRIVNNAYRVVLEGDSYRKNFTPKFKIEDDKMQQKS